MKSTLTFKSSNVMRHSAFAYAMLELEKAIYKAHKIAETEFMNSLHLNGCNEINDEWYRAMKATEAMTDIKYMISVEW